VVIKSAKLNEILRFGGRDVDLGHIGWLSKTDDSGLTVRGLKMGILLMETASPVFEAEVRAYLYFIHVHFQEADMYVGVEEKVRSRGR
jgi:hypothetical protein